MKLVKAEVSVPDEIANQLSWKGLNNLRANIREYVEEAIEDLACVHSNKDLKVTFE